MPDPRISLTDFVDFVTRSGMPKLTKVKQLKHRAEYSPYADFYRPFREAVIAAHAEGRGKASIAEAALRRFEGDGRRHHIVDLCAAYGSWWGRRALDFFPPPTSTRHLGGLDLTINPELGLLIEGRAHVIKLYLKEPALSRRYAEIAAALMHESLAGQPPSGAIMAILDVRRRRLHCLAPRPELSALLAGELASLATMWRLV